MEIIKEVLTDIVPNYLFCLSSHDIESYIMDLLCMPSLSASVPFSCFLLVLPNKKTCSMLLPMFQKFLVKRIIALLEEITSEVEISGTDGLMQSEHNQDVVNALVHLPDLVSNLLHSNSPPFFSPQTFNTWLSDSILNVYIGFSENRDTRNYARLISKSCILGLTESLADSFSRLLQLIRMERSPITPIEELLLLYSPRKRVEIASNWAAMIPAMRFRDFVKTVLESEFERTNVALLPPINFSPIVCFSSQFLPLTFPSFPRVSSTKSSSFARFSRFSFHSIERKLLCLLSFLNPFLPPSLLPRLSTVSPQSDKSESLLSFTAFSNSFPFKPTLPLFPHLCKRSETDWRKSTTP